MLGNISKTPLIGYISGEGLGNQLLGELKFKKIDIFQQVGSRLFLVKKNSISENKNINLYW